MANTIFGVTGVDPVQLTYVAGTTPQLNFQGDAIKPLPVQIAGLTLPVAATTTVAGTVKKASAVTALGTGGTSTIAQIETAVNAIIANLKTAGSMA